MKIKLSILTILLLVCSSGMAFGQSISLERVEGLVGTNGLPADGASQVTFVLRLTNPTENVEAMANGFTIYSDDGAIWTATVADTISHGWMGFNFDIMDWGFFDAFGIVDTDVDGMGADTIGYGGSIIQNTVGIPAGFDDEAFRITIGPIDATDHGKTICIDSCFFPPTGYWLWVHPGDDGEAAWDGPHCYDVVDPSAAVSQIGDALPTTFGLKQNYPNPFNPTTTVQFDIPTRSMVNISIFNVLGQKTRTLVNEELEAGSWEEEWNGLSDGGAKVSSGIYFYRMQAGSYVETKKMMLLK